MTKKDKISTFAKYKEYTRGTGWVDKKKEFYQQKNIKKECKACGSTDQPLHTHHNTYCRLGEEQLYDLVVLCKPCHDEVHRVARDMGVGMRTDKWAAHGTTLYFITKSFIKFKKSTKKRDHYRWIKLLEKAKELKAGTYVTKKESNTNDYKFKQFYIKKFIENKK